MSISMVSRKVCILSLGVLLASGWQISAAAGWVSGQVTAINPETNLIEINGLVFTLPTAGRYDTTNLIKALKPGQAVRYEADGKLIKRIEVKALPPS